MDAEYCETNNVVPLSSGDNFIIDYTCNFCVYDHIPSSLLITDEWNAFYRHSYHMNKELRKNVNGIQLSGHVLKSFWSYNMETIAECNQHVI